MNTLTTLEMRNELGKRGYSITRRYCPAPFYGSVFVVTHPDSPGAGIGLDDLVALIRYVYRLHFYA